MQRTRNSARARNALLSAATAMVLAMSAVLPALAATTVVVTPTNTHGWFPGESNNNSTITWVSDPVAPGGSALRLTNELVVSAKAQYLHLANTPLADVTELAFDTKQIFPSGPLADPSYQLVTCLLGPPTAVACPGFTTLVFEPYQNPTQGTIVNNVWQHWDVDAGLFWSTRTVVCPNGTILGTPGGPASYTLAQIKSLCPNAVVAAFGVNIGSNNPGWDVLTDLVVFNDTVYDFQLTNQPTDKSQCKNGGYVDYTNADGEPFKNQGQCVKAANRSGGGEE